MIKIACSSLSFDGFGDNNFVNTFDKAADAGYKNIELNCWHPSCLTPNTIRSINERCKKTGLEAISVYIGSAGGEDYHAIAKDVCHKIRAIDAACELGCRRVVFTGSSPKGSNGGIESAIKTLKEIMPYAEEKDVLICLENHESNDFENINDYKTIFDKVVSDNIGVCVDTGHFEAAGIKLNDVIDAFGLKINHIHLKENDGFGYKNFCYFGNGTTDNENVVKRMIDLGYSGYIDIEVSPEIGDQPFDMKNVITPLEMFKQFESNLGDSL